MKKSLPLVSKYNKEDTVVIVSPFPINRVGKYEHITGVSLYTQRLLQGFKNQLNYDNRKVIVLSEVLNDIEMYEVEDVLIYRCWRRGSRHVFNDIFKGVSVFSKAKRVFFHFEFNMYGETLITSLFPLLLLRLNLVQKNTTLLLHQVVNDLGGLSGHLNLKEKSLKTHILNIGLKIFYKLVLQLSTKVIVHDEILKDRLKKLSNKPVFVIPHGLENNANVCELLEARKNLGLSHRDFVVLCFGFVSWYKGSDWIVDKFLEFYKRTGQTGVKLILAGGKSANLKKKKHYDEYYKKVMEKAGLSENIITTGFVSEDQVHFYFCASDVVLLPYRTQMSASGPFSQALSYDRPFLLSKPLAGALETHDIKERIRELGIDKESILFDLKGMDVFSKITALLENKKLKTSLSDLSSRVKEDREWGVLSKRFLYFIDS